MAGPPPAAVARLAQCQAEVLSTVKIHTRFAEGECASSGLRTGLREDILQVMYVKLKKKYSRLSIIRGNGGENWRG
jgi:hypothetical protein